MDKLVKKIAAIVQARMGSTRLPGKTLKWIADRTVLGHVITRLKNSQCLEQIIIATSDAEADDRIEAECKKYEVPCFRGSQENVLSRYYHAAKAYNVTDVVRVCADNTLVDWKIIDKEIYAYKRQDFDIVKTGVTIPLGLGGEIFSFDKLETAYQNAGQAYQKEHVTPYIYENSSRIFELQVEEDYSKYRFTLDVPEDWILINKLYNLLYKDAHDFLLADVVAVMRKKPELFEINKHVVQKHY